MTTKRISEKLDALYAARHQRAMAVVGKFQAERKNLPDGVLCRLHSAADIFHIGHIEDLIAIGIAKVERNREADAKLRRKYPFVLKLVK